MADKDKDKDLKGFRTLDDDYRLPTGCCIDGILGGGLETRVITQVYGPPGSGKTNLCMQASVSAVGQMKKVVYIDTEAGHSFERLRQMAGEGYREALKSILVFGPKSFEEQGFIIKNLGRVVGGDCGLIVLDSAVSLYRLVMDEDTARDVNRELSAQMAALSAHARRHNLAVVITNQVYSQEGDVEPVGGSTLRYWSKAVVELRKDGGKREAILRRHRSIKEDARVTFIIEDGGIREGR
jgi:DNA repair protein RadB